MRSIYGSILLSSLLFTGVATTAARTFESGSFELFGSDSRSEIFAQDNGNFCTSLESQLDSCLNPQSQLLLASHLSKAEVDDTRTKMPRGSGRIDSKELDSDGDRAETSDGEQSDKTDTNVRGSGRFRSKNVGRGSGRMEENQEAHRASGRFEA